MTDPGLNRRLSQYARRSGFTVGLTMALTILLLIGGFIATFALLNPYLSDFISADAAPGEPTSEVAGAPVFAVPTRDVEPTETPEPTVATEDSDGIDTDTTETDDVPAEETEEDADTFDPDFSSNPEEPINLRPEPGTELDALLVLEPSTPVQYLDEDADLNGVRWMQFQTVDGDIGWIREIDVEPT